MGFPIPVPTPEMPAVEDIWNLRFSSPESRRVEKALSEDGYEATPEGLAEWVLDGIEDGSRGDALSRLQKWMKQNPEKVNSFRLGAAVLMRNIPEILRTAKEGLQRGRAK